MKRHLILLIVLFLTVPAWGAGKQRAVRARLLSNVSTVRNGKAFTVGVLFEISPGRHIYWKNPGDAGLATEVKFVLPEGLKASRLRWPVPEKFLQPGGVLGYGYKDAVLLLAEVGPPQDLKPADKVHIKAAVSWLECEKICVPGSADLHLEIPVGEESKSPNEAIFRKWKDRLPVPANSERSPLKQRPSVAGGFRPGTGSGGFTVSLAWKKTPAAVEWMFGGAEAVQVKHAIARTRNGRTILSLVLTKDKSSETESIELLFVSTQSDGSRKGVTLAVPLHKHENKDKPGKG